MSLYAYLMQANKPKKQAIKEYGLLSNAPGGIGMTAQVSKDVLEQGLMGGLLSNAANVGTPMLVQALLGKAAGGVARQIFAGEKAKTADKQKLAVAQKMDAVGAPREDIWKQTGWFKGVDGKWRWEIDDSKAKFIPTKWEKNFPEVPNVEQAKMGGALSHDGLFSAYPSMEEAGVVLNPNIKPYGSYHEAKPEIGLGEYVQMKADRPSKLSWDAEYLRGMKNPHHENYWKNQLKEAIAENPSVSQRELKRQYIDFMREQQRSIDELKSGMLWPSNNSHQKSTLLHEIQHGAQRREGFSKGGNPEAMIRDVDPGEIVRKDISPYEAAYELYRKLAGEVEARTVQKRMNMTPAERALRPPWLDYDVPEEQQIVRGLLGR